MSENKFKGRAVLLRKKGYTYSEICRDLGYQVPKGTMSYWCKNIELTPLQKKRRRKENLKHLDRVRGKALETNRLKQETFLRSLRDRNHYLNEIVDIDTQKIALAMLYLGEGYKWKSHRGLQLGCSDPLLISLYLKLLNCCYGIRPDSLKCRISYRADQDISKLQKHWSSLTGIPLTNFYKTKPDPRTLGSKTQKRGYNGVCVVSGGGTEIQQELQIIAEICLGP